MVSNISSYEDKKFVKIGKYLWVPGFTFGLHKRLISMEGPCCSKCRALYIADDFLERSGVCPECNKEEDFGENVNKLRKIALNRYSAALRSGWEVESLDLPPNATKKEDKTDQKYFVSVKVGQKDGKKVAMILIGEKNEVQGKKDYAQIFLDLDTEMVTFDKTNKSPIKLLAKFKAEFPDSVTEIKKQKQ